MLMTNGSIPQATVQLRSTSLPGLTAPGFFFLSLAIKGRLLSCTAGVQILTLPLFKQPKQTGGRVILHTVVCLFGDQRVTSRKWLSPFAVEVLGIELRSLTYPPSNPTGPLTLSFLFILNLFIFFETGSHYRTQPWLA